MAQSGHEGRPGAAWERRAVEIEHQVIEKVRRGLRVSRNVYAEDALPKQWFKARRGARRHS